MITENKFFDMIRSYQMQGGNIHDMDKWLIVGASNDLRILKYLYEHGLDIHYDNEYVLRKAIKRGNVGIVRFLCDIGIDINVINNVALVMAIKYKNTEIIRCFCEYDANINAYHDDILMLAIEKQDLIFLQYLQDKGMSMKFYNNHVNESALLISIKKHNLEMIKFFRAHDDNFNMRELLCAVATHDLEIVKYFIELGAVIHGVALVRAIKIDDLDILKYLYENSTYDNKAHLLDLAVKYGNLEIVKYLYEHDTNSKMTTKLLIEAAGAGHLEVVIYLHEHGVPICENVDGTVAGSYGDALMSASAYGQLEVVKYLCKHHPDINTHLNTKYISGLNDNIPITASSLAAYCGELDVVKYLHEFGADINAWDACVLRAAIARRHWNGIPKELDIIRYLLHCGINIPYTSEQISTMDPEIQQEFNNYANRITRVKRADNI